MLRGHDAVAHLPEAEHVAAVLELGKLPHHHAYLRHAFLHMEPDIVARFDMHLARNKGKAARQGGYALGNALERNAVPDGDIQLHRIALELGHGAGVEAMALAEHGIGLGQKVAPRLGEDGGTGAPVEKLHAKAVLKHGDMGAHHGLRPPKGPGGGRKGTFFRRGHKGPKLFDGPVHGSALLCQSIIFLMVSDFL